MTLENVEVGPVCCSSDGINFGRSVHVPNPSTILLDHVYVHDVGRGCAGFRASVLAAATNDGTHVDCVQFYGGDNVTIENSRFYRCANPQAFFFGQDQNGTFSNILVENNMIGQCAVGHCDHDAIKFNTNLACGALVNGKPDPLQRLHPRLLQHHRRQRGDPVLPRLQPERRPGDRHSDRRQHRLPQPRM